MALEARLRKLENSYSTVKPPVMGRFWTIEECVADVRAAMARGDTAWCDGWGKCWGGPDFGYLLAAWGRRDDAQRSA